MSYEVALTLRIILLALMAISALFIIFAVLKQPGNSGSSISAISGSSQADTFYGKNQAKRFENKLKKWTMIAGIVLAVCSVLFFVLGLI